MTRIFFISLYSVIKAGNNETYRRKMFYIKSVSCVFIYVFGLVLLIQNRIANAENTWTVEWEYEGSCGDPVKCPLKLFMDRLPTINITISNITNIIPNKTVRIVSDSDIFQVPNEITMQKVQSKVYKGSFQANAVFIGRAKMHLEVDQSSNVEKSDDINILITRDQRLIDKLFIISVATLVSILYINFGAAMDFEKVKSVLWRPIGPAIAFGCHFLFMPLVSSNFNGFSNCSKMFSFKISLEYFLNL